MTSIDFEETLSVLQQFFAKKEEVASEFEGFHSPSFTHTPIIKECIESSSMPPVIQPRGHRDASGRMVRYVPSIVHTPFKTHTNKVHDNGARGCYCTLLENYICYVLLADVLPTCD